jgi:hypothetical protein
MRAAMCGIFLLLIFNCYHDWQYKRRKEQSDYESSKGRSSIPIAHGNSQMVLAGKSVSGSNLNR